MSGDLTTTDLLNDPQAINQLLARVLLRLRALARRVKGGAVNPMLETDLVVDEAVVKVLVRGNQRVWSKDDFFRVVANAMRQVVIDFYRKQRPVSLGDADADIPANREPAPEARAARNDLNDFIFQQLQAFAKEDPEASVVMQQHLFGGDDGGGKVMKDIADHLGLDLKDAYRARLRARERLHVLLRASSPEASRRNPNEPG